MAGLPPRWSRMGLTDGDDVPGNNLVAGNRPPLAASVDLGGVGCGQLWECARTRPSQDCRDPADLTWIVCGLLPIFRISDMFRICCCTRDASKATSMDSVKTL